MKSAVLTIYLDPEVLRGVSDKEIERRYLYEARAAFPDALEELKKLLGKDEE